MSTHISKSGRCSYDTNRRNNHTDRDALSILKDYTFKFSIPRPKPEGYPFNPIILGEKIRQHRMDLHLFQREVAKFIGVDKCTIYNWEKGKIKPYQEHIPTINKFLSLKERNKAFMT